MQGNQLERGADRRRTAQQDDEPDKEYVPAFFTTPEFQARDPADDRRSGERRAPGAPKATRVQPLGADDEPLGGE